MIIRRSSDFFWNVDWLGPTNEIALSRNGPTDATYMKSSFKKWIHTHTYHYATPHCIHIAYTRPLSPACRATRLYICTYIICIYQSIALALPYILTTASEQKTDSVKKLIAHFSLSNASRIFGASFSESTIYTSPKSNLITYNSYMCLSLISRLHMLGLDHDIVWSEENRSKVLRRVPLRFFD